MQSPTLYSPLFRPFSLGPGITLKNRIFFSSMGVDTAEEGGKASDRLIAFYKGIIRGGAGMVILGNASIHPSSRLQTRGLGLHDEEHAEALRPLFRFGKAHNCEVVVQLQHYGAQGRMQSTTQPLLSPSGIGCPRLNAKQPLYRAVEMTHDDIKTVRQYYVEAAVRAYHAGARIVQLQAANGYLLSSFLSPYTNVRHDKYGGSPAKRMRLLCEIVDDIRSACPALLLSVRLGIDDGLDNKGQRPELIAPHVQQLESLGVVWLSLSMTINETFHLLMTHPDAARQRLYSGISVLREATSLPIGFAGLTANLAQGEQVMERLKVELVGMTRALFADNDLIIKTQQQRDGEIHACRFDGNCFKDKSNPALDQVYCCVNPNYLRPSHIHYE